MFDELVVYRPATCRPARAASVPPKRNDCTVNARWYVDGTMVIPLDDGKTQLYVGVACGMGWVWSGTWPVDI